MALGDVDRDGALDAVFANFESEANRICFGDGSGDFNCSNVNPTGYSSTAVAMGSFSDTVAIDTPPSNGTAVIKGNTVIYTPVAGFIGTDTFTYTLNGGAPSTFTGDVTAPPAPVGSVTSTGGGSGGCFLSDLLN